VFITHIRTINITFSFEYLLVIVTESTGEQNCYMGVKVFSKFYKTFALAPEINVLCL
jgi:hypothetical protein